MSKTTKFALGTLIGAAVGLIAGVLTAPKSGKETRADIKQKAVDLKEEAVEKAEKVKAKAERMVDEVKDIAKEESGKKPRSGKGNK